MQIKAVAKAVYGGAVAFVGALGTALTDGAVTPVEWCTVAGVTLAALGVIWAVPNTEAPEVASPAPGLADDQPTD